jgi:tetratricopeptide (TPR) repeat protein
MREPASGEMDYDRGNALRDLGRPEEALASYDRAIAQRPDFAEAHNGRGGIVRDLGDFQEALRCFNRAVALKPDFPEAHFNRGSALAVLGRDVEALAGFERAIVLNPDFAEAHKGRGDALAKLRRFEAALTSYGRAMRLKPDFGDAHNNAGCALEELCRHEEALHAFDIAIALLPTEFRGYSNRGVTLAALGRFEAALSDADMAIELQPGDADAHFNRGNALRDLGRHEEALSAYARGIALRPGHARAGWAQSHSQLATGDFEQGWRNFEGRWNAMPERKRHDLRGPPWLGDSQIDNKTIIVHAEQGLGDSLQFCRYIPMLATRATVILEVPPMLVRLFGTLRGVSGIVAAGDPLPRFDAWIPMMSLPLAFRTTVATIPADVPYLRADPERAAAWRSRIAGLPGRKIGLVWAGAARRDNPLALAADRRRSVTLQHFASLATIPELSVISLQKGDGAEQARTPPPGLVVHDWTEELDDFAGTAALVEALDLVISVDTSVAHLAGALGKPVWILNRYDQCWRWLRDRTDSPWYPTARLFRQQTPGDWSTVIEQITRALRARE